VERKAPMETLQDKHKATVRYVHEQVNEGNLAVFEEVLGPDYVRHCQAMPPEAQEIRGFKLLVAFVEEHLAAFPDWNDEIEFILAEEDKIAYVTRSTGTQTGQMGPWSATGKTACLTSIIIHRFENEKIAETWISWDNLSFLTQLGHFD
jgi:predicted ester cyclase